MGRSDDEYQSDDDYDRRTEYSEDFDSGDSREPSAHPHKRRPSPPRSALSAYSDRSKASSKPSSKSSKKEGSRSSSRTPMKSGPSHLSTHVMDAHKRVVSSLTSKVSELENECEKLRKENKTLVGIQRRQEKELGRLNDQDADIPALIRSKEEDVRVLTKKYQTYKAKLEAAEKEIKTKNAQLLELQDKNKALQKIVDDKNLKERAHLEMELGKLKENLVEKDAQINRLEKSIDYEQKLKVRDKDAKVKKHEEHSSKLQQLMEQNEVLAKKLAEKDKLLASGPPHTISPSRGHLFEKTPSTSSETPRRTPLPADTTTTPNNFSRSNITPSTINHTNPANEAMTSSNTPYVGAKSPEPSPLSSTFKRGEFSMQAFITSPPPSNQEMVSYPPSSPLKKETEQAVNIALREAELRQIREAEELARKKVEEERLLVLKIKEEEERLEEERKRKLAIELEEQRLHALKAEREAEERRRQAQREEAERILREKEEAQKREEERQRQREEEERQRREEERILAEQTRLATEKAREERMKKDLLLAKLKALDGGDYSSPTDNPSTKTGGKSFSLGSDSQPGPDFASKEATSNVPSWLKGPSADNKGTKNQSTLPQSDRSQLGSAYDNLHRGLPSDGHPVSRKRGDGLFPPIADHPPQEPPNSKKSDSLFPWEQKEKVGKKPDESLGFDSMTNTPRSSDPKNKFPWDSPSSAHNNGSGHNINTNNNHNSKGGAFGQKKSAAPSEEIVEEFESSYVASFNDQGSRSSNNGVSSFSSGMKKPQAPRNSGFKYPKSFHADDDGLETFELN